MARSPSEDATSSPPDPLLSTLPTNGVNVNRGPFDIEPRQNVESNATSTTAATRLNSLLYKLRVFSLHIFSAVGVLAFLSVLAGKTDFRWSLAEEHGHHSTRDINPQSVSGNSGGSLEAHDGDGPGAPVAAPLSHEEVNETRVEAFCHTPRLLDFKTVAPPKCPLLGACVDQGGRCSELRRILLPPSLVIINLLRRKNRTKRQRLSADDCAYC